MFEADGYEVVKNLVAPGLRRKVKRNLDRSLKTESLSYDDGAVEKAYWSYAPPVTEGLLQMLCPVISKLARCELYPTYSYLRLYQKGAVLTKHTDRAACEISVTTTIWYDSPARWPIFLDAGGKTVSIELKPGDGLLYKGMEVAHWREEFEGSNQLQVFLHYVRKDGPYESYKYDKRPGLRLPSSEDD